MDDDIMSTEQPVSPTDLSSAPAQTGSDQASTTKAHARCDSSTNPPSMIEGVVRSELTGGREPTLPSLLWPGTQEAYERQCTCPVEENWKRVADGLPPRLRADCRVHNKICQAEVCGHSDHALLHARCEHCTNVLHICEVCEAIYMEDGDDPTLHGWMMVINAGDLTREWRCRRCR